MNTPPTTYITAFPARLGAGSKVSLLRSASAASPSRRFSPTVSVRWVRGVASSSSHVWPRIFVLFRGAS